MDAATHPAGEKADGAAAHAQADFPQPSVPAPQRGDCENQPDSAGMGAVLCGRPFEPVLLVHPRLGRKEDSAPSGARAPASRFRLEAVEQSVAVWNARTLPCVPSRPLTVTRPRSNGRPHNPCREAVQERVVRQIRTLRAMRRELETGPRHLLPGHEGGNPGYRQGAAYGLPRQFPTLPTSIKSASMSRSATRNADRPAATTTNGSSATTLVQLAGIFRNRPASSWK